jgi:hypothetical protein
MTISGFTFVYHALELDYPVVESIKSMLPICDEFIVNVGLPDDGTIDAIRSIDDKIKIITTPWYPKRIRKGGWRYDQFADIPLFTCQGDWIFFLQADEVVHEEDLPKIKEAMSKYIGDPEVEGILLRYYEFYGSYDFYRTDRIWPEAAVRMVKNGMNVYSANDAQSFYVGERRKMRLLNVADIGARIYHYGWARNPAMMKKKNVSVGKYWHSKEEISKMENETFDYYNVNPKYLAAFKGSHPKVMQERIDRSDWTFDPSKSYYKPTLKSIRYEVQSFVEGIIGRRIFGPHHYKIVK